MTQTIRNVPLGPESSSLALAWPGAKDPGTFTAADSLFSVLSGDQLLVQGPWILGVEC